MKTGTALIYRPGSPEPEIVPLDGMGEQEMLDVLQGGVGGYIEVVPGFAQIEHAGEVRPCRAFCNEDGKRGPLPVNRVATQLWHCALPPPGLQRPDGGLVDVLVGPVIVVYGDAEFMAEL